MLEYIKRIDQLATQSRKIPSADGCADLLTMFEAAREIASDLSKELVECRRRGKLSSRSETLITKLDESLANIEKMLTYATLLYPKK